MKEYVQATVLVVVAILALGLILIFAPVILAFLSVLWPLLVIPIIIVIVAEALKRRR